MNDLDPNGFVLRQADQAREDYAQLSFPGCAFVNSRIPLLSGSWIGTLTTFPEENSV